MNVGRAHEPQKNAEITARRSRNQKLGGRDSVEPWNPPAECHGSTESHPPMVWLRLRCVAFFRVFRGLRIRLNSVP